jgi:Domain of unknown function DUF29
VLAFPLKARETLEGIERGGYQMRTTTALYDQDFYLWCLDTCATLGAREFEALDLPHLIEEIRALAGRDRRELASRLETLVLHLLKWGYQPLERSGSWRRTIRTQRRELRRLLQQNPSLHPLVPDAVADGYPDARLDAGDETGLPLVTFPATCPWTLEQILDADFWPEGEPTPCVTTR